MGDVGLMLLKKRKHYIPRPENNRSAAIRYRSARARSREVMCSRA